MFALTLLTRLPFAFGSSLGTDPDSWRLALAGQLFIDTGEYRPSRAPSYPLVELVAAALAGQPWWVFTLLTAVVGAIGVAAFASLLRTLAIPGWVPLTVGLALTPVVFRNDVTFMDHTWALTAVLMSWAAFARNRLLLTGFMIGLAVACRPTSIVAAVVVVALLVQQRRPLRAWTSVACPAVGVALAFFALPFASYGLRFVTAVDAQIPLGTALARLSTGVWGAFGAVAIAVAVVAAAMMWFRSRSAVGGVQSSWRLAAAIGAVIELLLFLRLPADPGYLAPLVPMVLIVLGVTLSMRAVVAVAALVAVSSFIAPTPAKAFGTTILGDASERRTTARYVEAATQCIESLPPGAVVVADYLMPEVLAGLPRAALASGTARGPIRDVQTPELVTLPGGQVIVYGVEDVPVGMSATYHLISAGGLTPELPIKALVG